MPVIGDNAVCGYKAYGLRFVPDRCGDVQR